MAFYFSFAASFKYVALDNTDKSDDENDASSIVKTKLKATSETESEMTIDSNKPKANITNIDPIIEEHGLVEIYGKAFTTQLPSKVFTIT